MTFWNVTAWAGLAVVFIAMAVAVYVKLFGDGKPWIVLALMAPGVVAWHVGTRMAIREAKKRSNDK